MPFRWNPREHIALAAYFFKWIAIASPVGALIGAIVALFLWSLDRVTHARWDHPWLLFLLPLAGIAIGWMYHLFGRSVEGGNNLIVDQIHKPGGGVPSRMTPLVLIGTVVTHLFGGSAGREGTAVQIGGSMASTVARLLKLPVRDIRTLLMVGVAAGFGAVFGTPLTGAIFAVEVLAIGRISYEALLPCLIGSIAGDWTTTACGIDHTHYHVAMFTDPGVGRSYDPAALTGFCLAKSRSLPSRLASPAFYLPEFTHGLSWLCKKFIPWSVLRPAVGGLIVIAMVYLIGTRDYLGLGVTTDPHTPGGVSIISCFQPGGATPWSWWWKILFTAVTLGSGFARWRGNPFISSSAPALGNTLAWLMHAPVDLFAALGFVAVFAGATNTPLACTVMAVELFGRQPGLLSSGFVIYAAVACFVSYLLSAPFRHLSVAAASARRS